MSVTSVSDIVPHNPPQFDAICAGPADGGWRMADGGWRMADGGWRMADGGWRMADEGHHATAGVYLRPIYALLLPDGRVLARLPPGS
ncbi:hypothetical protein [Alicyclobacillus sp. ALC3]|uniref:hypothetical protein n=1 Tax=Alicyclobacillus sp. ALC3 TaxID=2796143 RepID=UPI0023785AB8|nr:hypothetical protein [Alicyclobacillus sp. ALC3]WDL95297.1 hypothetical protein JC200_12810 [Alicyclobacillus sp. ALC3]